MQKASTSTTRIFLFILGFTSLHPTFSAAQQKTTIKLEGAKAMKNLNLGDQKIVRYIGNVRFFYDNTRVRCDSAYYSQNENWFDAFNGVVVSQGSSNIYGDKLHYDGRTSEGRLTGKEVKMVDKDFTLVTDALDFNSKTGLAFYTTGGVATSNDSSTLTSIKGYYNNNDNLISFANKVVLKSPDGNAFTDSLSYHTKNEVAYFFGPTFIYDGKNFIYCEKGWHNRKLQQSNFQNNAYLISNSQKLFGENIYYDKQNGYARGIGNVVMVDTVNRTYIYGQKASYWQEKEEAEITEQPYMMMIDDSDSLFLRTDKLLMITAKTGDNQKTDSSYRLVKAIGRVMYYRHDIQGVCDSMIYNTRDSVLEMYGNPVMWNEANQMTADFIRIHISNKKISQADFLGNAFISSREDSAYFSQMRGKTILARFSDGQLTRMDITGNGQVVYFVRDKGQITMVNRAEGSNVDVHIKNNKVSRVVFKQKPTSNLIPIEQVEPEDMTLKGFKWLGQLRPESKYSVIPTSLTLVPLEKGTQRRMEMMANFK